jgi:2'-phosphotransferase
MTDYKKKNDKYYTNLSKALSWILRHKAVQMGLTIESDGYILLNDVLALKEFKYYTVDDVRYVVDSNDKKRFSLKESCDKDDKIMIYIRANQGHSNKVAKHIDETELLTKLMEPLPLVLHGTTYAAYKKIKGVGLKKMKRSHIHFSITEDFIEGNNQQSGIRSNCEVLIYIDMKKAMDDGLEFFMSDNKVVLCSGVGSEGLLDAKYFENAIDRKTQKSILF